MIILHRKGSSLTVQGDIRRENNERRPRIPQPNPKQQEQLNAKPDSSMTAQKPSRNDKEETPEE
jgi:hypothetical protein